MITKKRSEDDAKNELNAYDNIGIQYYYLNDIDRAKYYHNRMMNNELERDTSAKRIGLDKLKEANEDKALKRSLITKTVFQKYRDKDPDFKHLHENMEERKVLDVKLAKMVNKELLESPRYEEFNLKDKVLKKALQQLLQSPAEDTLRRANTKLQERKGLSSSLQTGNQYTSNKQQEGFLKEGLFSNLKVALLANQ